MLPRVGSRIIAGLGSICHQSQSSGCAPSPLCAAAVGKMSSLSCRYIMNAWPNWRRLLPQATV
jgi:hypothetical protein